MGRRARLRSKLRDEDVEELEQLLDKTEPGPAAEEQALEPTKEKDAADPTARVLELQKSAGNRATAAALARWPLFAAPQPVAQWPKQLEMVIDGKTVIPLESAQMGVDRRLTNPTGRGVEQEKPVDESGEMIVTLKSGKWSTDLFRESLHGRGYKTVEIVFPGKDGKGFRIVLADVLISSYSVSGQGDGPVDSISLSFKKREFSQDPPPAR
jgi:type VI secretion system secreted protein Hcp